MLWRTVIILFIHLYTMSQCGRMISKENALGSISYNVPCYATDGSTRLPQCLKFTAPIANDSERKWGKDHGWLLHFIPHSSALYLHWVHQSSWPKDISRDEWQVQQNKKQEILKPMTATTKEEACALYFTRVLDCTSPSVAGSLCMALNIT